MAKTPNDNPQEWQGGAAGGKDSRRRADGEPKERAADNAPTRVQLTYDEQHTAALINEVSHFKSAITHKYLEDGTRAPQDAQRVEMGGCDMKELARRKERFEAFAADIGMKITHVGDADVSQDGRASSVVARYNVDSQKLLDFVASDAVKDVMRKEIVHEKAYSDKHPSDYKKRLSGKQVMGELVRGDIVDITPHLERLLKVSSRVGSSYSGTRSGNTDHSMIGQHDAGGRE